LALGTSEKKMNKLLKYGLLTTIILIVGLAIAYAVFLSTFQIFEEPESGIIQAECDYEGIRQATVYEFGGNAVTVPLIAVSINNGCGKSRQDENKKVIFSAEYNGGSIVNAKWLSFDSLQISYSKNLEPKTLIDKVTFKDSSLNVNVIFVQTGLGNTNTSKKIKETETADSIILQETFKEEDVIVNEYLTSELRLIRVNFKRINSIAKWSKIDKIDIWESTEGGQATYYYSENKLEKIVVRHFGETFQHLAEYYLLYGELSFVFDKSFKYNRPIYWDSIAMKENNDNQVWDFEQSEIIEERTYFKNGKVIHQLNNQDCGSPFAEDYLKEEQDRLITEFNKLIKSIENK
jgi:hypothetical protein